MARANPIKFFKCAWCGETIDETTAWLYKGEFICKKCLTNMIKESKMTDWEKNLDRWLTTPPEEGETLCFCAECDEPLYVDDDYFNLDGQILCEDCARDWLDDRRQLVTESMVKGERPEDE